MREILKKIRNVNEEAKTKRKINKQRVVEENNQSIFCCW